MKDKPDCRKFIDFLVNQQPVYDQKILVRPDDGWIGHVECPARFERPGIIQFWSPYDVYPMLWFSQRELYQDRFEKVYPDPTADWSPVTYVGSELGSPSCIVNRKL